MSAQSTDQFPWTHFVRRSGLAGRNWLETYSRFRDVDDACWHALAALRLRDLEVGRQLLDRAHTAARQADGAVRCVLGRWLFGVEAYYFYCIDEFDQAARHLDLARESVISALGELSTLLPLANHCVEFELQKARCARQRREWDMMAHHIELARDMVTGRRPLCVLHDGRSIHINDVQRFYASIAPFSPEEWRAVEPQIDDDARLRAFETFVRRMYILPDFVIDYR